MVDFNELLNRVNKQGYITKTELKSLDTNTQTRLSQELFKLNPYTSVFSFDDETQMWVDDKIKSKLRDERFDEAVDQRELERELYNRDIRRNV